VTGAAIAGVRGSSGASTAGRRVVVVGGGLAGITAATALRDVGIEVTLLESRQWLGGLATSFSRGDMMIDNGQHVFLRCCTAYRGLLERLGATGSVALQDRFDVTVLSPTRQARLRRTRLPSPLHMTATLARYRMLPPAQRLRVARAALAFRFLNPTAPGLDGERLGDWLAARGQDERARRTLWDLFIVSTLNIDGDAANVPLAATVVKTALLGAADAADIGIATVPLGALHSDAAGRLLQRLGVQLRLGTRASGIRRSADGGFEVELDPDRGASDGERSLAADAVVIAVPPGPAARLAAGVGVVPGWEGLGESPIVNVHVIYDRAVTTLPFAAAVDSPVQWVFDKTRQAGLTAGQYLAVSLSAADGYVDMPVAELRQQFLPALEQLFPAAAGAGVTDFFVTRERRATFRQGPGSGALRPGTVTNVPGLALAGSWTDTGWPDTMEGAVRSGLSAAQALVSELSKAESAGQDMSARAAAPAKLAQGAS
jgi:squalene-associated FAD-dependent desaturase